MDEIDNGEQAHPDRAARSTRHVADLTRLRRLRRELRDLTAALTALVASRMPVPDELRARLRRLETGAVAVWTPCLTCSAGDVVKTLINDPRGGEPSAILCDPCDQRLTEEATRPAAEQDGGR